MSISIAKKIQHIYREFPQRFWIVVGVSFIDRVGGTLLFPFLSLYITQKFEVGMTQAGMILGLFSIFGMFGGFIGGALTDRFGRRKLIIFGLVFSAISTLTLGTIDSFSTLIPLAVVIGLLTDIAGPAHSAMIADILPEQQRQEGYGILRVVGNMAWIIGPSIGGFVAGKSFFALFVIDAVVSCLVAFLFFILMPETKPETLPEQAEEGILQTFIGYVQTLRDLPYMAFLAASIVMGLVYQNMYNSLSVYLRDVHGIQPSGYGFLLTSSAVIVILFQFSMTRAIKYRPPFLMMALGVVFYMFGFGMFGFVTAYALFVAAMIVITIGEMIIMPSSQALAANFAPLEMRGRYMAAYGMVWMVPSIFGPSAAGLILDYADPNMLWYASAGLCAVSALGFYALHLRLGKQARFTFTPPVETAEAAAIPS